MSALTRLAAAAARRRDRKDAMIADLRRAQLRDIAVHTVAQVLIGMGDGHIPTWLRTVDDLALQLEEGRALTIPSCRYCGAHLSSPAGRQPCPGDTRQCQHRLPAGADTAPPAFERHHNGWLCGRPGSYDDATFTAWTCTTGHVTTLTETPAIPFPMCNADLDRGCLPDCPSHGLSLFITHTVDQIAANLAAQLRQPTPRRKTKRTENTTP